jgi:Acetyltransferase (GNAT) domain
MTRESNGMNWAAAKWRSFLRHWTPRGRNLEGSRVRWKDRIGPGRGPRARIQMPLRRGAQGLASVPNAAAQVSLASEHANCVCSLFQQPWWLNALAPGAWDAVVVVENDEVVGRLPFVRKRRFGLRVLTQPPLTPSLGPWVKAVVGKASTRLARDHEILTSLIESLPPHDVFRQNFHYTITNILPFCWHAFRDSILYSYTIDELQDVERIWAGFGDNVRGHIRKAARQLAVRPLDDIEAFLPIHKMSYERQGLSYPYSSDLIRRLDSACSARGVRRMFLAEDAGGVPHAALYLVWDSESAYNLMSGSGPHGRASGAMSLLIWEAIKFAGQVTRRFDFEGSMVQGIERFYRDFGPRQVRYAALTRGATLRGRFALLAHQLRSQGRPNW